MATLHFYEQWSRSVQLIVLSSPNNVNELAPCCTWASNSNKILRAFDIYDIRYEHFVIHVHELHSLFENLLKYLTNGTTWWGNGGEITILVLSFTWTMVMAMGWLIKLVYVMFQNWMRYPFKVVVLKSLNHSGLIFRMNNLLHIVNYRIEEPMQQTLYNVGHKTY
jgi:hypothetical protein